MANGDTEYVVQIPGVSDIIRLPPIDSEEVKRERLSRWRLQATQSPIPEPLRWIPEVINWLDDAQDILIVTLIAGKPILRRLPSRFVPYLGWALLGNDIVNILTGVLSTPLVPRLKKARFIRETKKVVAGRHALVDTARAFLLPGRIKWVPFLLQAGQVLDTFTGWGLQLGGIMGAVSDTFWGLVRAASGDRVKFVGPPAHDPLTKAASFLARSFYWRAFADVANPQELGIMVAAVNAAATWLGAPNLINIDDNRLSQLADTTTPIYDPWNQATRNALAALGYPTVDNHRIPIPTVVETLNYGDATRVAIAADHGLDIELAARLRPSTFDWPYGMQAMEYSAWTWDVFAGGFDFVVPLHSPMEKMLSFALETGVVPPFIYFPEDRRIEEQEQELGIRRMPRGQCTPTEPGFWKLDPVMAQDPIYPPPDEDPNVQIAHWCAIALLLYCGRAIQLPIIVPDQFCNYRILGFRSNTRSWGMAAPAMAAGLVWGNNYFRYTTETPDSPPPAAQPFTKPSYCKSSGFDAPSLSGNNPEFEPLAQVLRALPKKADIQDLIGLHRIEPREWKGRDWLDSYLRALDPRRSGHSAWPVLNEHPQPTPWEVLDLVETQRP